MLFFKGNLPINLVTQSNPNPVSEPLAVPPPFAQLPPFRIEPIFVPRIWGSKTLRPWFPVDAPENPIGEVWLTGDDCVAATGPAKGRTLASLADLSPCALLGYDLEPAQLRNTESANRVTSSNSPLLIKLLFAQEKLSVQVHPDDKLAVSQGYPRGKTECWYVLDAEPNAEVAVGFKPGLQKTLTRDEVQASALDGSLESCLNLLPIAPGDMVLVDAGTVHAVLPGSVLLEVQENSDTTYRLFDYGRPRQLHLEKSLEALKFTTNAGKIPPQILSDRTLLLNTEFFTIESFNISAPFSSQLLNSANITENSSPTLSYLFVKKGSALITSVPNGPQFTSIELQEHTMLAIPASSPGFLIQPHSDLDVLRISAPVHTLK
jgi:mannose-6-phosphate isomerase